MALLVHIVTRSAPREAVEVVERAFAAAGLKTMLTALGNDESHNSDLLLQGFTENVHERQVWIVPAMFVDLLAMDQDSAGAARELTGLGPKKVTRDWLLITLEPVAEVPDGCNVIPLDDIRNGYVAPEALRSFFQ